MFDDQSNTPAGGQAPSNLPVGEPEDIFSGTDEVAPPPPDQPAASMPATPPPAAPSMAAPPPPDSSPVPAAQEPPKSEYLSVPPPPLSTTAGLPDEPTGTPGRMSAVDAGVLQPKQENVPTASPGSDTPPQADYPQLSPEVPATGASVAQVSGVGEIPPPSSEVFTDPNLGVPTAAEAPAAVPPAGPEMYSVKGPTISRGIMTAIILVVVLVIVGGGGWWIYSSFINPPSSDVLDTDMFGTQAQDSQADDVIDQEEVVDLEEEPETPEATETEVDVNQETIDNTLLFGEEIDSDGDQLDDVVEGTIGTDPQNWDSDADGLGDGEEVLIWETDPMNPDTDGDGYEDGHEVDNGYSPKGPGRLLIVPTSTADLGTSTEQ